MCVKHIMEGFLVTGLGMAYTGNSRPASGGEHHMSHYFEIVGIVRNESYLPHGIDVCFSAVETAKLRERLLELEDISAFATHHDPVTYRRM